MVGEKVVIAGMVTSTRRLHTRDGRPFIIATLEDLNGNIEVTAWTEVYTQTRELWQEGKILLVEGVVKLRDERPVVNCYGVRQYQPESEESKEVQQAASPTLRRKIVINITQTDKGEDDVARLHQVMDTVIRYPGQDTVLLSIVTPQETINMKLPDTVNYCPELVQEINRILGVNSLMVEEE